MIDLGKVKPGSTIRIPFGSYAASTGASSAASSYAAADIQVFKDGSTTQRASASGITATTDFDSLTGINFITIDLADNTTADFWAAGSEYIVVVADITVDSQTVRFPAGRFLIAMDGAVLDTTIATLSSQTSFTLTVGPADNNALVGCVAYIHDAASAVQCAMGVVSAYTGSTKTVTLAVDPAIFTMAAKDNISFLPRANVYSVGGTAQTARDIGAAVPAATAGASGGLLISGSNAGTTTLAALTVTGAFTVNGVSDVAQTGDSYARIGAPVGASISGDVAGVKTQTAAIETDTQDIQSRLPAALVAGRMDSSAGAMAANVLTAAAINADAFTAAKFAADVTTELQSGLATATAVSTLTSYVDTEVAACLAVLNKLDTMMQAASGSPGDYEYRADALRRAPTGSGGGGGSIGVSDIWAEALPGAYSAGSAGYLVGTYLDALISNIPTAIENADALLDRDMSTGVDSGSPTVRTVRQALRALRNKWANSAGTYSVYKENDITVSWTSVIATSAGAEPIVGSDPA